MRYSRRISNYPKRITLFDMTHMMSDNMQFILLRHIIFYLYACYHILSAFLSFYVILGYDIKIYHFMDNYT